MVSEHMLLQHLGHYSDEGCLLSSQRSVSHLPKADLLTSWFLIVSMFSQGSVQGKAFICRRRPIFVVLGKDDLKVPQK